MDIWRLWQFSTLMFSYTWCVHIQCKVLHVMSQVSILQINSVHWLRDSASKSARNYAKQVCFSDGCYDYCISPEIRSPLTSSHVFSCLLYVRYSCWKISVALGLLWERKRRRRLNSNIQLEEQGKLMRHGKWKYSWKLNHRRDSRTNWKEVRFFCPSSHRSFHV